MLFLAISHYLYLLLSSIAVILLLPKAFQYPFERKYIMSKKEKFIPKNKLSKKAQKELNQKNRGSWGICNPVTKRIENKKRYNRKKVHKGDDFFYEPFDFIEKLFTSFHFNDILSYI